MKIFLRDFIIAFVPSLMPALIALMLFKLSQINERKRWLTDAYIRQEAKIWIEYRNILAEFVHVLWGLTDILYYASNYFEYDKHPYFEYKEQLDLLKSLRKIHSQAQPHFYNDLNDNYHGELWFIFTDLEKNFNDFLIALETEKIKVQKIETQINSNILYRYRIEDVSKVLNEYFNEDSRNILASLKELLNCIDKRYISHKNNKLINC